MKTSFYKVCNVVMDAISIYFSTIKNNKTWLIQTEIVRSTKYLLTLIEFVILAVFWNLLHYFLSKYMLWLLNLFLHEYSC